jgi:hypothetical protein
MDRIALAVTTALALAAGAGCAPQTPAAPAASSAPADGKAKAPVSIEAQLQDGSGRVTVRFGAAAKDVKVEVRGTGGLAVTSEAVPLEGASFDAGAARTFDVAFTPGPGRSHLSVAVSGKFRGAGRSGTVTTFSVGEPTPEQQKASGTVIERGGERIKVVPGR